MWRDDTAYDAARVGLRSAAGLEQHAQETKRRAIAMQSAANKARLRARSHERKLEQLKEMNL
jgi:hypothetical protein